MSDAGQVDANGIGDEAEVTLNDEPIASVVGPLQQNDDGTYVYPEGVKGPADHDTFEVNPSLVEAPEEPTA